MVIDKALLDNLSAQAKNSPRLRMNFDLRNGPDDTSQRMLNALEPGTVMPIHRHRNSSETVVVLRGRVKWKYYDENGALIDTIVVKPDGDVCGLSVPIGQWHNLECLEPNTVILETKDGAWEPQQEEDVMKICSSTYLNTRNQL